MTRRHSPFPSHPWRPSRVPSRPHHSPESPPLGYGYIIGVCIVLFVLLTGGFGVLLWTIVNRKQIKRSLLTHPRDRNPRARAHRPHDDLQTDAPEPVTDRP